MNIKTLTIYSVALALFSAILISCGGGSGEEEQTDTSSEFEAAEKELQSTIEEVIYEIPSPSEIPGLLERTGVDYNESLLNSQEKASGYTADTDKSSLNLGIYATDIGYLISYDKVQEALNYMAETKKIGDELGLSGSFETATLQKFEENLSNKDTLTILLNQTINKSSQYLKDSDRTRLAALMITGSMVEGLYISCELINGYPADILPEDARNAVLSDLIRVILEQERGVNEVLRMLTNIEQTEPVAQLVTEFQNLKANFDALDVEDKIANNEGGLILSDQNLVDITSTVRELRAMIVD